MMKSASTFSLLKRIDDLIRPFHPYLQKEDEVYFLGEYTVGSWSDHSPKNRLIFNYKKDLGRQGHSDWSYKNQAIMEVANLFRSSIFNTASLCERVKRATFAPIPPSKAKNDAGYDDRNYRMLKIFAPKGDVRELIVQKQSRDPLHTSKGLPRSYVSLLDNYGFNEDAFHPTPEEIWLFDDTLIKGTHFRAAKEFLEKKFPDIPIVGFFIARGRHFGSEV
jgi:hypothetical protein